MSRYDSREEKAARFIELFEPLVPEYWTGITPPANLTWNYETACVQAFWHVRIYGTATECYMTDGKVVLDPTEDPGLQLQQIAACFDINEEDIVIFMKQAGLVRTDWDPILEM